MQRVTRIGALSLGKLMGGVGAVMGLFFGLIFTAISLFGATMVASDGSAVESLLGLAFGVGALFVLPILYGALAFVQGVVVASVANVAMSVFGGLELEISD